VVLLPADTGVVVTRHPGHRRPRSADITVDHRAILARRVVLPCARPRAADAHTSHMHNPFGTPGTHATRRLSSRTPRTGAHDPIPARTSHTTRSDYAPAGLVGSPPYTACTGSRRGVASRRARVTSSRCAQRHTACTRVMSRLPRVSPPATRVANSCDGASPRQSPRVASRTALSPLSLL
jgi:hypothetical protein